MNTTLARMRERLALAEHPQESETMNHDEKRSSRIVGTDSERLRLKMFLLEHRRLLFGPRMGAFPADQVEIR